jgi:hypothetical protein
VRVHAVPESRAFADHPTAARTELDLGGREQHTGTCTLCARVVDSRECGERIGSVFAGASHRCRQIDGDTTRVCEIGERKHQRGASQPCATRT